MHGTSIAYSNLRAEMARRRITVQAVAEAIGKSRNTAGAKLARRAAMSLDEAFAIKRELFPDKDVPYLFAEAFQDGSHTV